MGNKPLVDFTFNTIGNNGIWESGNSICFLLKKFLGFLSASLGNPLNILCLCRHSIDCLEYNVFKDFRGFCVKKETEINDIEEPCISAELLGTGYSVNEY